jgi:acetylornithine/succinyldiaminopimelate/putrescine aminotransferase
MGTLAYYGYTDKAGIIEDAVRYWNPQKTQFWIDEGIPLVIGGRQGYDLYDIDGHRLIDVHLNGGTFNLGHRNPEVVAVLREALDYVDVGNHHFPSPGRAALAKALVQSAPGMSKAVFGSSGGEAIDVAIKSARFATGRRVIVSIQKAFHGHTGLAVAAGDGRFAHLFQSDRPDEFRQVRFNDVEDMRKALATEDVAAVILESIPATYGFPLPQPGYLSAVKSLCEEYGALYIADEVQVGLGRTGAFWCIEKSGVRPDIIVTGKGLGGGVYPITAAILGESAAAWLEVDGFAHMGTFGGSELGCAVAMKVLEITQRPETVAHVSALADQWREGLAAIRDQYPRVVKGIRQDGLVIGLEFFGEEGAKPIMSALYERGVWAIFSTLDPSVLQLKPGILLSHDDAAKALAAIAGAAGAAGATGAAGAASTAEATGSAEAAPARDGAERDG